MEISRVLRRAACTRPEDEKILGVPAFSTSRAWRQQEMQVPSLSHVVAGEVTCYLLVISFSVVNCTPKQRWYVAYESVFFRPPPEK